MLGSDAVTSANQGNTRRNPVPYDRREAAIGRFSRRGSAVCSTPEVAALYARLRFRIGGVEPDHDPAPARPWDVLLRLAAGDPSWRKLAHPATLDVYDRYRLDDLVRAVVNDPVVGDEDGLTTTRDYHAYAEAFAASAARKWELVRDHVRPGRIVDVGCGAGAVLELADREPALRVLLLPQRARRRGVPAAVDRHHADPRDLVYGDRMVGTVPLRCDCPHRTG